MYHVACCRKTVSTFCSLSTIYDGVLEYVCSQCGKSVKIDFLLAGRHDENSVAVKSPVNRLDGSCVSIMKDLGELAGL